ncbi:hypothetical protein RRG08_060397 [Elysia crispata]|uniref:Uncharacterized protein n=1 Tax=Elysia crispata TaxID=231223 RepID=A0AAE1DFT3_9GAST|nr:hypothetical protein RRG08_060397 [Elysia crispata]
MRTDTIQWCNRSNSGSALCSCGRGLCDDTLLQGSGRGVGCSLRRSQSEHDLQYPACDFRSQYESAPPWKTAGPGSEE